MGKQIVIHFAGDLIVPIEAESDYFSGLKMDNMKHKGLGFWCRKWKVKRQHSRWAKSQLFVPWYSVQIFGGEIYSTTLYSEIRTVEVWI